MKLMLLLFFRCFCYYYLSIICWQSSSIGLFQNLVYKQNSQNLIKMALKAKQQIFRERVREREREGVGLQGSWGKKTGDWGGGIKLGDRATQAPVINIYLVYF